MIVPVAREVRASPGPGQYPLMSAISKDGTYELSRFVSSRCRRFGTGVRDTLGATRGTFAGTPGPGTYRETSEFGHYKASEKFVREAERTETTRKNVGSGCRLRLGIQHPVGSAAATVNTTARSEFKRTGRLNRSLVVENRDSLNPARK